MEKKIVYRIFTIADYEREALYFREMHAKGWKLRKVSYSILLFVVKYTFEKCQPEQVSYQLIPFITTSYSVRYIAPRYIKYITSRYKTQEKRPPSGNLSSILVKV